LASSELFPDDASCFGGTREVVVTRVKLIAAAAMVSLAGAGWGCGDDAGVGPRPDGHDATSPDDAADATPPTEHEVAFEVTLPGGASAAGWRVINRFGEATVPDPPQAVSLPLAAEGVTPTLALPPEGEEDDRALLHLGARLPERDGAGPTALRIDVGSTAVALIALHPWLLDADPGWMREVVDAAAQLTGLPELAAAISDALARGDDPTLDAAARAARDRAARALARHLGSPYEDTAPTVALGDAGPVRVHSLDGGPPVEAVATDDGALAFRAPEAGRLSALVRVTALAPEGTYARGPSPDEPFSEGILRAPEDLLGLRDGPDGRVWPRLGPAVARVLAPRMSDPWAAGDHAPLPIADIAPTLALPEGALAWLAAVHMGAVGGDEAALLWAEAPEDALDALRLNLAGEALRVIRALAPDQATACAALVGAAAAAAPVSGAAHAAGQVAGGEGDALVQGVLVSVLDDLRGACVASADPATRRAAAVTAAALLSAPASSLAGLTAAPASRLPPLLHGRGGHAAGRLLLVRGEPFAPEVVTIGGVGDGVGEGGVIEGSFGQVLVPAGHRLDEAGVRYVFEDARGRLRGTPPAPGGGVFFPHSLAGELRATAIGPGGARELPTRFAVRERLTLVEPAFLYRGGGAVRVHLEGAGLDAEQRLRVGAASLILPEETHPRGVELIVDPTALPEGSHPLALEDAAGREIPLSSSPTLTVAGPPALLGISPSAVGPERRLTITALGLHPAGEAVTAHLERAGEVLPLRIGFVRPGAQDRQLLTAWTPAFEGAGPATLVVSTPSGSAAYPIDLVQPPARHERTLSFALAHPPHRVQQLQTALTFAHDGAQPQGDFRLEHHGALPGGGPWCPEKISPASVTYPTPCTHPSGVCDDRWIYQDDRDPQNWFHVTPPPGRSATGACQPIPGLTSWTHLASPDAVLDTIVAEQPIPLGGVHTLRGPALHLVVAEGGGGGFTVLPPEGGGRSDLTLDLTLRDVSGAALRLDGVAGVRVRRLVVEGIPGACTHGLVVTESEDVVIEELDVTGCATGLTVEGSEDVRLLGPATLFGNGTAARVVSSAEVLLAARVGWRDGAGPPDGQVDGLVISDSERVEVRLPVAGALSGDALRVTGSADVRILDTRIGHALADGAAVTAGLAVGTGLRLGAGNGRIRVEGLRVVGAQDGVLVSGPGEVLLRDVELGALRGLLVGPHPPGNRDHGLRIPSSARARILLDGGLVAHNGVAGVAVASFEARLRVRDLASGWSAEGGDAGLTVEGEQPCLLSLRSADDARLTRVRSVRDGSALCGELNTLLMVRDLEVLDAQASGVRLERSGAMTFARVLIDAPGGPGLDLEGVSDASFEDMIVLHPGGPGVRFLGPMSNTGPVTFHRVEVAGGTMGADLHPRGSFARLIGWAGADHALAGITAREGRLAILGGAIGPGGGIGVDLLAGAGPALLDEVEVAGSSEGAVRLAEGARATLRGSHLAAPGAPAIAADAPHTLTLHEVALDGAPALAVARLGSGSRIALDEVDAPDQAVEIDACDGGAGSFLRIREARVADLTIEGCAADVSLDGITASGAVWIADAAHLRLRELRPGATLQLDGPGAHLLALGLPREVRVARRGAEGIRVLPGAGVGLRLEDGASAGATIAPWLTLGAEGTATVGGAPDGSRVEATWRGPGGAALGAPGVTHVAGGEAALRGLAAPGAGASLDLTVVLPDGGAGLPPVSADGPAGCRLPANAAAGPGPSVGWAADSGWVAADGATVLIPDAEGASSCGALVAYARSEGGARDIWLWDREVDTHTRITLDPADDREPTLSPACDELVWVSERAGAPHLHRIRLPFGAVEPLTSGPVTDRAPWLSADAVLFSRRAEGSSRFVLMRLPRDGGEPAEVFSDAPGDALWPSSTPDGGWIAWTRCPAGEAGRCHLAVGHRDRGVADLFGVDGLCDDRRPVWLGEGGGAWALAAVRRPVLGDTLAAPAGVLMTRYGRALARLPTPEGVAAPTR